MVVKFGDSDFENDLFRNNSELSSSSKEVDDCAGDDISGTEAIKKKM
jgi:hypothetical protein